jgi:ATP-binding cassette subfamily B protein
VTDEAPIGRVYDARLMKRLLRYLRPYRYWVAASVALLIVHSALGAAGPYLTKVAIDHSLSPQPGATSLLDPWLPADRWSSLQFIVLVYLAVQIGAFVFRGAQIKVMNYTGQRVMLDLRAEIFGHLQKMGVSFYDRNPVGRLVTRLTTDVDTLNEMFTSGVVAIAGDLITLLFIVSVMIHLSPRLTLVMFAVAPLVLVASIWFRRRARQSYRDVRVAVARINSFLQEQFSGMAVVQIFSHEGRSWRQFNDVNAEHRDAQYQAIRAHAYFLPIIEWLGVCGLGALLVYGGVLVSGEVVHVGVLVAFLQYGTRVFRPLQDLSEKYNILQSAMASSERIFHLLDTPPDPQFAGAAVSASAGEQLAPAAAASIQPVKAGPASTPNDANLRVEFKNVWFAYQGEEWVLRDVSLTVEPGEMVAIVGHTGAGKTTLISLLLRFYEAQRGTILVGGRDVRDWPANELRRRFGVVLQDPYLFSGTIESNIRLRNGVSDERLREVIREVNLETFVNSLPNGVQEPILERGASLSSGQKQLLSFARALAFNPRFLILDEATSSVDTETEFKIREALSRMLAGHTSIVVAHRLSTIQKASRIVVMHKGQVRESGSHQELLAQRGIYFKLYQLQYREQEAPVDALLERPPAPQPTPEPQPAVESQLAIESQPAAVPSLEPGAEPQTKVVAAVGTPVEVPAAVEVDDAVEGKPAAEEELAAELKPPVRPQSPLLPEVAIQASQGAVNGADQPAPVEASAAKKVRSSSRRRAGGPKPSDGVKKQRRSGKQPRKKSAPAADGFPGSAMHTAQLDLTWEVAETSAADSVPLKSPTSSPTMAAPKAKPRRKASKRARKQPPEPNPDVS